MRLQIVCALASGIPSLSPDEQDTIISSFLTAARRRRCSVLSCRCGDRWLEAILEIEPNFDLAKAMTNLKAVTSRHVHRARGGPSGIWTSGYAAFTLGEAADVDVVAMTLAGEEQD